MVSVSAQEGRCALYTLSVEDLCIKVQPLVPNVFVTRLEVTICFRVV